MQASGTYVFSCHDQGTHLDASMLFALQINVRGCYLVASIFVTPVMVFCVVRCGPHEPRVYRQMLKKN